LGLAILEWQDRVVAGRRARHACHYTGARAQIGPQWKDKHTRLTTT
jgi:hypothetical protein